MAYQQPQSAPPRAFTVHHSNIYPHSYEMMEDHHEAKKGFQTDITELLDEPRPDPSCLGLTALQPFRRRRSINVLIIVGFVVLYGVCVVGAIVPQLWVGAFPFYIGDALDINEDNGEAAACSISGEVQERFEINMPMGSYSYIQVKIIDAAWNLMVGRGLQTCIGLFSLWLFRSAVLRITQESTMPLPAYSAIVFNSTSITTIPRLVSGMWTSGTVRARLIMFWLVVSIAYVAAVGTLLDLSTGYMTNQVAMVRTTGGVLYPLTATLQKAYNRNFWEQCNTTDSILCPTWSASGGVRDIIVGSDSFSPFDFFDQHGNWRYGDEAPVLCEPAKTYAWGFSTGYLWIFCATFSVWVLGMFALFCDSLRHGYLWQTGRGLGDWRNIIDIGLILQARLGPNVYAYHNRDLEKEVRNLGPVGFEVIKETGSYGHIRLTENPCGCQALHQAGQQSAQLSRDQKRSATWPLR